MSGTAIQERAAFDFIRYANCWEDPALLLGAAGLAGARCLSIASGGDNSLSLLTADPRRVVAFDLSPAQLALVELKMAAFRRLEYREMLEFLGFAAATADRIEVYRRLRPELSERAAGYFDAHPELITGGVIHGGKFERYFRLFTRWVLPLTHTRSEAAALLAEKSPEERRAFYWNVWNNRRFRMLYKLFFNRWVMGRLGRDPAFFQYVDVKFIARELKQRTDYALAELPTHDNPYLHYIVKSEFAPALPHYVRRENFDAIRSRLDRITLVAGSVDAVRAQSPELRFDFYNLSDIFEYLDETLCRTLTRALLDCAAPGARLTYCNMMVPRRLSALFPEELIARDDDAAALFLRNRAFFYRSFHIDEVKHERV